VYLAGDWRIAGYPSFHVATVGDFRLPSPRPHEWPPLGDTSEAH
jgi:hypothetical protein